MAQIDVGEVVERISKQLEFLSGKELAEIAGEMGIQVAYVGDGYFEDEDFSC